MSEKELKAMNAVRNGMSWSMIAGLIPLAFVDMAAVAGVQMKMLAEIAKIYGVEFRRSCGKAGGGSLIGSVVPGLIVWVPAY
jgi:uncharacterized protein (DUF697 family)